MIEREITQYINKLATQYPAVAITGPRQSGKTTLARAVFARLPYVSLENLDTLSYAQGDPRSFLAQYPQGAIFDEVQRCPDLLSYLQQIIDEGAKQCRFVLTGSQQFGLLSTISQSLAGRCADCTLLPFSLTELQSAGSVHSDTVENILFTGLYPPIHDRNLDAPIWYENYIRTYLERDVRRLVNIQDLHTFQIFLKMCAARCGQLVNLSGLATDCGIAVNTAKGWLSVLQASYVIFLLQPYYRNFGKRLIKTPKLYFYDPGLAAALLSIPTVETIATHALRGHLFESFIISEIKKKILNHGLRSELYFWRDRTGNEIDVLIDSGTDLHAVEIKSGKTVSPDFFSGLKKWSDLTGVPPHQSCLIYGGDESQKRTGISVLPWFKATTLLP